MWGWGMSVTGARRTRADATRNRSKILDAARAALAVSGEASTQSIARAAGVGQGTLYRHFPTRDALVLEVHRRDVSALVDAAPALLERFPAARALRVWCEQLADYGRVKHGLLEAVYADLHHRLGDEGAGPVVAALGLLLDAGRADGTLTGDLGAGDVLLLLGFLWRTDPGDPGRDQSDRLLDFVLAALTTVPDRANRTRQR